MQRSVNGHNVIVSRNVCVVSEKEDSTSRALHFGGVGL